MNLLQRMCSSLGFSIKTKVVQEKTFFCGNCPPGRIKLMAAVVLLPCFLEFAFAEPRNVLAKDSDSLAVPWERFNKDVTDSFSPVRALYFGETFRESGYKFLGRNAKGVSVPNVHGNNSSDYAANKSSFWASNSHDDWLSALGFIPALWLMFWAANLNTPNEKINRREASGAMTS